MRKAVVQALPIFALLNFVAFAVISELIGGDAFSGQVSHGHYYLGHKGHLNEVSRSVYLYSMVHAVSAMLGILGFVFIGRRSSRLKDDAVNARCKSCGRPMAEDNFYSECWRCSLSNTHRRAPLVWFALFAAALAFALWLFP